MPRIVDILYRRQELDPDEKVYFAFKQIFRFDIKPKWVIITSKRILFVDESIWGRYAYHLKFIPYMKVKEFYAEKGIMFMSIFAESETGDVVGANFLEKGDVFEIKKVVYKHLSEIAIEPPSVEEDKKLWWEKVKITKPSEGIVRAVGRVNRTAADGSQQFPIGMSPEQAMPKTTPKISIEELKAILSQYDKFEALVELEKLLEKGMIGPKEYLEVKKYLLDNL